MKCKIHPKYKGIYKPRCNCESCWKIYLLKDTKKLSRDLSVRDYGFCAGDTTGDAY